MDQATQVEEIKVDGEEVRVRFRMRFRDSKRKLCVHVKTFSQTISPDNVGADGEPKTFHRIREELFTFAREYKIEMLARRPDAKILIYMI